MTGLFTLLSVALFAMAVAAHAEDSSSRRRIAFLGAESPSTNPHFLDALRQGKSSSRRRPERAGMRQGRLRRTSSSGPEYAKLRIRLIPGSSTRGLTPQMNASS